MTYQDWIATYLENTTNVFGKCRVAVEDMNKVFPELKVVRGHVMDLQWGRRSHWWLETPTGAIVDPTKSQFPCVIEYEPWTPESLVRLGRCVNCGGDIWRAVASLDEVHQESVCGPGCEAILMAEYES